MGQYFLPFWKKLFLNWWYNLVSVVSWTQNRVLAISLFFFFRRAYFLRGAASKRKDMEMYSALPLQELPQFQNHFAEWYYKEPQPQIHWESFLSGSESLTLVNAHIKPTPYTLPAWLGCLAGWQGTHSPPDPDALRLIFPGRLKWRPEVICSRLSHCFRDLPELPLQVLWSAKIIMVKILIKVTYLFWQGLKLVFIHLQEKSLRLIGQELQFPFANGARKFPEFVTCLMEPLGNEPRSLNPRKWGWYGRIWLDFGLRSQFCQFLRVSSQKSAHGHSWGNQTTVKSSDRITDDTSPMVKSHCLGGIINSTILF